MAGKHTGSEALDLHHLAGAWHIGLSYPGMFPNTELTCPCPKAPCGLAVPVPSAYCPHHHGQAVIRQAHRADECDQWKKKHRRR